MLETTWFALWGLLWAIYFVLDGFDLGIGTLMPFVARDENERKSFYSSMGPYWNGNEVWLITAGGVTFAAFPTAYAIMFSSLYSALLLILFGLILRGVALEFRSKFMGDGWKKLWDICLFVGNFAPALLFGVAFANLFRGILIDGKGLYHGTLFSLLNGYGLMGGVLFVLLFTVHGSLWLAIRTKGELKDRVARLSGLLWSVLAVMAVVFLIATWFSTRLYDNYLATPALAVIPIGAVASLFAIRFFISRARWWNAWFASSAFIALVTLFGVVGLYPNLLVSSIDTAFSLTAFNSASSPLTLKIMLGVALTFVPVVIAYQIWVYRFFEKPENASPVPG
ncbi:MAG: cytochrome d ubiquinol oxidase subunit II, partial [Syntrophobacteraceae bacterium]